MPFLRFRRARCAASSFALLLAACRSDVDAPVQPTPHVWRAVATTVPLTCALDGAGRFDCLGALGTQLTPVAELAPERFDSLSSNNSGICALRRDGAVRCVGIGGRDARSPIGDATAIQIAGGQAGGCALAASGAVTCWRATYGPTGLLVVVAAPVAGVPSIARIAYGERFGCGLTADGVAYCWPTDGPISGLVLGSGSSATVGEAVRVQTAERFASISAGNAHACGLTAAGAAFCWGANGSYAVGVPHTEARPNCTLGGSCAAPERVTSTVAFRQIEAAQDRTCALTADGRAYSWGLNVGFALGVAKPAGDETCRNGAYYDCTPTPTAVTGSMAFARLGTSRSFHQCALTADGQLYCWGNVDANGAPDQSSLTAGSATPVHLAAPTDG